MVRMTAIEPINGKSPGDVIEVGEREAVQLEQRGLACRSAPEHENKMAAASENKAHPTAAAGVTLPSAASRAARASQKPTAAPSKRGAPTKRAPAKSSR